MLDIMNSGEEWRDIQGFVGYYQVSNLGRVRSLSRYIKCRGNSTRLISENILTPINSSDYLYVTLYNGKLSKRYSIHKLVALSFLENSENKSVINHINGIKQDNTFSNLEWVTSKENTQHALKTGLMNSLYVKVYQFDLNGIFIQEWKSSALVKRTLNIDNSQISKACKAEFGKRTAGGYKWSYTKEN